MSHRPGMRVADWILIIGLTAVTALAIGHMIWSRPDRIRPEPQLAPVKSDTPPPPPPLKRGPGSGGAIHLM